MTREEDIWYCSECGDEQGRHDMWFEGDICGDCNSKKMNKREFLNGFESWTETYFEVVDYITTIRSMKFITGIIGETIASNGTCGLWELAVKWTDEFEVLSKDREWNDEFYDEVEEFCKTKNEQV